MLEILGCGAAWWVGLAGVDLGFDVGWVYQCRCTALIRFLKQSSRGMRGCGLESWL